MTMALNKGKGVEDCFWYSKDYAVVASDDAEGYGIVNTNTGQIEMHVEQEPPAVMALLYLQDHYDKVMADPESVYKMRRAEVEQPAFIAEYDIQ